MAFSPKVRDVRPSQLLVVIIDPETNPTNDAIGSRVTVYFNLNFGWTYKWTKEMDIVYGIDFTHFSISRCTKSSLRYSRLDVFFVFPQLGFA